MIRLTVIQTFNHPFYAPHYVAAQGGFFAREGLHVETMTAGDGGTMLDWLKGGRGEIALGGPIRAIKELDGGGSRLICFAEVASGDGFFLLGRYPLPAFTWADLRGKSVILYRDAPTPNLCLRYALVQAGIPVDDVRRIEGLTEAEALAAFRSGQGDFLIQIQPTAEALLLAGEAHLATPMVRASGHVPYSAYLTTPRFAEGHPGIVSAVTTALARAQAWLHAQPPEVIARTIHPRLPDIPERLLRASVARYLAVGIWGKHPRITELAFRRLEQILASAGYIRAVGAYARLVAPEFAEAVTVEGD
jgi:NitT/TauT family transport system substrate-binding protein